jgi:hypothetical protein
MGATKNSSPKSRPRLCPKFTTKDSHTSLPRSRSHNGPTNPRNKSQTNHKRERNSRRKGHRQTTVLWADGPRGLGGPSPQKAAPNHQYVPAKTDGLYPTRGRYADNATCADSLASPSGQSDKHLATKPLTLCDRNVKCS